jgi:hypothetical protein
VRELLVPFEPATVFEAMAWHDVLAAAMARLLLWTDPAELPDGRRRQCRLGLLRAQLASRRAASRPVAGALRHGDGGW